MATNWEELANDFGGNYKPYLKDGLYKVKANGVEIKEVGTNGSVIQKFSFEDLDENSVPTVDHWLSFKNANWRKWHNRCLMIMFGLTKEQAEKTVDICEKTDDKATIIKTYQQMYKKLLDKKPEVEIEVYTTQGNDGKYYARAEFTDRSVAMPHDGEATTQPTQTTGETVEIEGVGGAEEIAIEDVPF